MDGLCGKEIKGYVLALTTYIVTSDCNLYLKYVGICFLSFSFQECYNNAKSEDMIKRKTRGKIPLGQNLQDFNQDQLTKVLKRQCQNKNVTKGQRIYNHPEYKQKIPGQK